MQGVQEETTGFRVPIDLATASRFRRIAGTGPVYEVTAINGDRVTTRVVDTDEEFEFGLAEVEADPIP